MELELGMVGETGDDENFESPEAKTADYKPKICNPKWFADCHQRTDDDDIKFYADHLFYKKRYEEALTQYLHLLTCTRYGSARSLLAEVYESASLCMQRLSRVDDSYDYCDLSKGMFKSADQRAANLYVTSRLLKANNNSDAALLCAMKRLLLLHPYNHQLWYELCELVSDERQKLIYLTRTRLLLDINAHVVQSFVKSQHEALSSQVDDAISHYSPKFADDLELINQLVRREDATLRLTDDWLLEERRRVSAASRSQRTRL